MANRRGFTLIELLAVGSIVVIGLLLTAPAIFRSVQQARKLACRNNIKQLGIALHSYLDTYQKFPPGWVSRADLPHSGTRWGWQTYLLPFVDEAPLYNDIAPNDPPKAADQKKYQTQISLFRCPTDLTPETNPLRGDFGTSNYSGNFGHIPPPRLGTLRMSDSWPGLVPTPPQTRGLFFRNSSVAAKQITDGFSNTILLGERGFTSGSGIWLGVTDNGHEDDIVTDCSHRSQIDTGWHSFSSLHGDGVNILMADGSSRYLDRRIESLPGPEMGVLQKLGCRDDGKVVDLK